MPQPIATWNPVRGVWEESATSILCGHSVLWSPAWPVSGTWDDTGLYPLPPPERPTSAREYSSSPGPLLKTPTAQLAVNGGSQHPSKRRAGGHGPTLADEVEFLLPTPGARDWKGSRASQGRLRSGRPRGPGDMDLMEAVGALIALLSPAGSGS
jgi:hypothetical protein